MGVYSNTEIFDALKSGVIICEPFEPKLVAEASLDTTLGHYYYRTEAECDKSIYNPFDKTEVNQYFKGPFEAETHEVWCERTGHKPFKGIPMDHPIIVLQAGERILAHTHEFIGIRSTGGAASVHSRSSWGRNGLAVCFDAGWVDPGYINRITLEIYNLNKHEAIVVPVGERIAQFIFHKTGEVKGSYELGREGVSGKYSFSSDIKQVIADWKPEMMLPKSYKDTRNLPLKIKGLTKGIK
ncbi:MAG: deoxycytidine triphosphate deaminase [Candidatus Nomurabacteria bacterium]|jgi:dCTP deaminase|nr:deoxycytidine triphosphate deaminase [Candidatus Nomurabacteria bacterium]